MLNHVKHTSRRQPGLRRALAIHATLLGAIAGLCLGPQERAFASTNVTATDKVFVGYLFGQPAKVNFGLYTHLCHAFLTANESGIVRTNTDVPGREITSQAHAAGVKVLLSLGGWGWDKQFAAIVQNAAAENLYVNSVVALVSLYEYDGIDLDWEYPDTQEEVVGFERLARRFRGELDRVATQKKRPMLQTMAIAANPETLKWLKTDLLLETMDWLNVMTYDMAGDWSDYAGHHSPLFASSKQRGPARSTQLTMDYLVKRGLPAQRLAMGIPLYGKGFPVSEPYAATRTLHSGHSPNGGDFSRLVLLQTEKGWSRYWDNETKTPWLIAPDRSAVIGYDDEESVALKTDWAMNRGFRGVFFWHIGSDLLPDGSNPIQETALKHFKAPTGTNP